MDQKKTDAVLVDALGYARSTLLQTLWILLAVMGAALTLSPLFVLGGVYWPAGLVLLSTAVLLLMKERGNGPRWLARAGTVALLMLALVLEAIPGGAVLVFAAGPEERIVQTFSCFSLTPLGYANFAPFLTAVLTVAALVLRLIGYFWLTAVRPKRWGSISTMLAAAFSLLPWLMFGAKYTNAQSMLITATLSASSILQLRLGCES